jgi:hypothetical protein
MKRIACVVSGNLDFIEVANFFSDRYHLLTDILEVDLTKVVGNSIAIEFDVAKMDARLKELLAERKRKPLDIPDYKGRFREEEVFVEKNLYGESLKLCNSGFDNQIIFLANLLESAQKEDLKDRPSRIFLAENHGELRNYLQHRQT